MSDLYDATHEEWFTVPDDHRLAHHDVAGHIAISSTSGELAALREYIRFTGSEAFTDWLSRTCGQSVRLLTTEIARYQKGDQLREHSDAFDNRHVNLVAYFDEDWCPGDGGELVYTNEAAKRQVIEPKFGSAVLLPVSATCRHAVQTFNRGVGRWSVASGFQKVDGGRLVG